MGENLEKKIANINSIMNQLFERRLIEKLSRPSNGVEKQQLLSEYEQQFEQLHAYLKSIGKEEPKNTDMVSTQAKSSKSIRNVDMKWYTREVKKIEYLYNEVVSALFSFSKRAATSTSRRSAKSIT